MKFDFGPPVSNQRWDKLQAQAQRAAPKALKELIELIYNKTNQYAKDDDGKLVLVRAATPDRVRLTAINSLLDRAFGRPVAMDPADMPAFQQQITQIVRRVVHVDSDDREGHTFN